MKYRLIKTTFITEVLGAYFNEFREKSLTMAIIGANNGDIKDFLSCYILNENVTSILVEPAKPLFRDLKNKFSNAKSVYFENSALYNKSCKKTFYRVNKAKEFPEWINGIGSFDKKHILNHENQLRDIQKHFVKEIVDCITFDSLLKKYNFLEINLLQIDTEGQDFEILKSINLKKNSPDIIIFEFLHITFYQYYTSLELLEENDYLVSKNNDSFDIIGVHKRLIL